MTTNSTAADRQHFESIDWCSELLKDPDWMEYDTTSREYKASTEDSLTSETLNSKETIKAWITMYRKPTETRTRIDEVKILVQLGAGVCGHPYTCHGGIISTIMDEVQATWLSVNRHAGDYIKHHTATASLKVDFVRPVRVPGAFVCTSYFKDTQGRKHYLESNMKDENGVLLAKAEGLWISLKDSQRNL